MNSFENLRIFVSKFVSLSDPEFDYFSSFFEFRSFRKHQRLTDEGEIEKYLNFIETGLARLFFFRGKDQIVLEFSMEGEIICCYESFLTREPSNFYTEAIEPLTVYSITLDNLETLFQYSPKIERLGRLFATQQFLKKANFDYNRVRVTSQQRFLNFLRNNGELIQRIPQKYLASYLDMKPETFSRMKHLNKERP